MLILSLLTLSVVIAVCAFTYAEILTDTGMILFKWRGFLYRLFKSEDNILFKILVGCSYCVAGQWALWIYAYISIFDSKLFDKIEYNPFIHIAFVLITVFFVAIVKKAGIYEQE